MDFSELVKIRQSVRKFNNRLIDRDVLNKCTEAARLSPSACNAQPWKFLIVDDPELVKRVASCTYSSIVKFNKFTDNAAAFAVVVMETGTFASKAGAIFTNTDYALMDMGMAVEHFCLQAAELNLGTCILGWRRQGSIKKLLNIPTNKKIGLVIAIGYEKDPVIRKKVRKPIEEMSSYNKY
ncbi:MAG: nitroreductase family protein [Clostridiales bacterium]|nr:nitroreductase family protein [Clostridiales bacterium]